MSEQDDLRQQLSELRTKLKIETAQNAILRIALQKIRGVLYCLRHPEDAGKPIDKWRFSPTAVRDLNENYDLPKLMAETRPEEGAGLQFLVERREQAEQLAKLTARVNFVVNTRDQHVGPVPEWVIKTLRGENPNAEPSDE